MSERSCAAAQAREDLERAVAALRDSAAWRQHLAVLARFHHYSLNNQLLIGCQMPEATYVRGFTGWLDAGRSVRKGERGIRILAPRPWTRKATEEEGAETIDAGVAFAVVHVFDVSQTDPIPGHPHPWEPPVRHSATGDEATAWAVWEGLMTHAGALGLTVSTRAADPLADAQTFGYYHHSARAIWVRPDRDRADMAATLAHELAHAVTREATAALSREAREVVAESVAYAVGTRFGLDLALRSTTYVASWLDEPEAFRTGMAAIHDAAASLINAVEEALAPVDAQDLAA